MKRITPPILYLISAVWMIALHFIYPLAKIIPIIIRPFGAMLLLTGLAFTIMVRKQFNRADTEIHTFKKPAKLITGGLFRISRNPIYLGFSISLTGIWLLSGMLTPLAGVLLFIAVTNCWYIPFEEKTMEQLFGQEYLDYKSKVRRWIG